MARKRTKPTAKQAQTLLDWLVTLHLPTRVINALRRDLEVVMGQREGEPGSGVLAGVDQARFTEELYRNGGGQVGHVPSVAKSAIEALRAAIPAPASADGGSLAGGEADALSLEAEALPPAETTLAPADTSASPVYGDDFVLPLLDDEESTALTEAAEALDLAPAPSVAAEVAGDVTAPAEASELASAPPAPADAPAAPVRRRGRPPRGEMAPKPAPEPSASAEASVRRRGRPRRSEAAPVVIAAAPAPVQEVRTATAATPLAPEPLPAVLPVLDPSADVLLRLWRELHPQGRQATLHYIAGLLIEA